MYSRPTSPIPDHEIGRVIQAIDDMGKLDNTLIIDIEGDNGNSGKARQSAPRMKWFAEWRRNSGRRSNEVLRCLGFQTKPIRHGWWAWTWAFDTPFSWTKQIASHFGGTRQGMAISWPKVITDKGGVRNQFHHMIHIVPTILELICNFVRPTSSTASLISPSKACSPAPSTRPMPMRPPGTRRSISR